MDEMESRYKEQVAAEAAGQWGGLSRVTKDSRQEVFLGTLVQLCWLAHIELARGLRDDERDLLGRLAGAVGSRSGKPRIVLRKAIQVAQDQLSWKPTPKVLAAAGMRADR